eukprot:COSAG01_NODE_2611_length_7384_cov_7.141386_7_plen_74_part_00
MKTPGAPLDSSTAGAAGEPGMVGSGRRAGTGAAAPRRNGEAAPIKSASASSDSVSETCPAVSVLNFLTRPGVT